LELWGSEEIRAWVRGSRAVLEEGTRMPRRSGLEDILRPYVGKRGVQMVFRSDSETYYSRYGVRNDMMMTNGMGG
jgi:hypothetical protein